ncbi:MAG: hypothetical protein JWP87_5045, partial [Labilithrix sp.]|nr:hypothetical protein [Labilithrix sp.]
MRRPLVSDSAPVRHRPQIAIIFAIALGGCKRSAPEVNDGTPRVELRLFEPFPSGTLASAQPKPAFAALACDGRHVYGVSKLGVALTERVPGIVTDKQPALDTLPDHLSLAAVTVSASSVVAVGARGVIVRREDADSMWKPEASPVTTDLHGVAQTPDWIVAVGTGGTVVARRSAKTPQAWTRIASPTQEDLFAVSPCIADDVSTKLCAVGGRGTVLVGDATPGGVVFRSVATGTEQALRAVTPAWWNIGPAH